MARNRSLAAFLLMLEAGCGAEPQQPHTAAPDPIATAAATVAIPAAPTVAAVAAPTSASREPTPSIPDRLTGAPALIYRALDTGAVNARSTLVTRRLQRFENQARLTVELQTVSNSGELMSTHLAPFGAPAIRRFVGSASDKGKQTTFDLSDGSEKLTLECEMGVLRVAVATAVRRSSRQGGCNGERGHWVPGATKRVEALRCGIDTSEPDPSFKPDRLEEMAFTVPPGIEFLYVNDDCVMQGGGYRFVPADLSVGPIRTPGGR